MAQPDDWRPRCDHSFAKSNQYLEIRGLHTDNSQRDLPLSAWLLHNRNSRRFLIKQFHLKHHAYDAMNFGASDPVPRLISCCKTGVSGRDPDVIVQYLHWSPHYSSSVLKWRWPGAVSTNAMLVHTLTLHAMMAHRFLDNESAPVTNPFRADEDWGWRTESLPDFPRIQLHNEHAFKLFWRMAKWVVWFETELTRERWNSSFVPDILGLRGDGMWVMDVQWSWSVSDADRDEEEEKAHCRELERLLAPVAATAGEKSS